VDRRPERQTTLREEAKAILRFGTKRLRESSKHNTQEIQNVILAGGRGVEAVHNRIDPNILVRRLERGDMQLEYEVRRNAQRA